MKYTSYTIKVPVKVWRQIKSQASLEGVTLNTIINKILEREAAITKKSA